MSIRTFVAAGAAIILASCGQQADAPGSPGTRILRIAVRPPTPRVGIDPHQRDCIASAVWHEAGGEPVEGQVAVAEVVLTRASTGGWPATPCGVVRQPHQFSFVHDGDIGQVPRQAAARIHALVEDVASGRLRSRVRGAVGFHTPAVVDHWGLRLSGRNGGHLFFAGPIT